MSSHLLLILTGSLLLVGGNPLTVLSKQINMRLSSLRLKCPIYDTEGKLIPKVVDDRYEHEVHHIYRHGVFPLRPLSTLCSVCSALRDGIGLAHETANTHARIHYHTCSST